MTYRVVVTDFVSDDLEPERRVLDGLATVEALGASREDDLAGRIDDADAVMMYHTMPLTAQTIGRLRRCRIIVRCGVGVDNVDHAFAAGRGIPVANVPDYGTEDVADSAIGMALALARGTHYLNSRLRSGAGPWSYTQAAPVRRLRGRVFGIVGLGRIGTAAALRAKALGMDVAFYDPYKPDGCDKALGVRRVETLGALLRQSHVLSLHCPLTRETRLMIDGSRLTEMQPESFLVNTARGGLVDSEALVAWIEGGLLAGAGVDVLAEEPPAGDDVLVAAWRHPGNQCHHRVILNPHAAFYSEEGLMDMRVRGAEACRRALTGEPLRNVVNGVT